MPRFTPLSGPFNAGELSPRLHARTDFAKYANGAATVENLLPLAEGAITRRPGTRFVAEIEDSGVEGRLIDLQFSEDESHVIELGDGKMRFYFRQGRIEVEATDAVITNGTFDANITGWTDSSAGTGAIAYQTTIKGQAVSCLGLNPGDNSGSNEAQADQAVTTSNTGQEHVLKFRILGDPGDPVEVFMGSTLLVTARTGYHCVAFTPSASPFTIIFYYSGVYGDKIVGIDDVSVIPSGPIEIDTPWSESQLYQIGGPSSGDVRYLFHPDVPTHKLIRRGLRSWSLEEVYWNDGPYLKQNSTTTTLTPAATSGPAVVVTASSIVGINDGNGFQPTDVGRLVRIDNPASGVAWGWGIIRVVSTDTQVTLFVNKKAFAATTADVNWRLGAWSGTTGYPRAGAFFEQRLYAAGTANQPQTLWASQTGDFENMSPDNIDGDNDGTVEDDDALEFTLSADEVNPIIWLSPGEDTLAIGTSGGEWVPTSEGAVITPNDITVRKQTSHGSADARPVRISQVVLFLQKAKRKVREFAFSFESDGFVASNMTRLAEHITKGGVTEMAYQQEPDSLVWAVRGDGTNLSMTFRRDEDVVAWARHIAGGVFSSGQAVVESVVVIPGFDDDEQVAHSGDRDEVWMIIKRTINGQTKRYVEFYEGSFETGDDQDDAYYVDSCITYEGSPATVITGLDHLEGQTVKIWGDGYIRTPKTVSSGQITLDEAASKAQIGLGYSHTLRSLKIEGGNPAGTAIGKRKRISSMTFVLLDSLKLEFDSANSTATEMHFRTVQAAIDTDTPLYTGEHKAPVDGSWADDVRVVVSSDQPAPFTLLAAIPEVTENPYK